MDRAGCFTNSCRRFTFYQTLSTTPEQLRDSIRFEMFFAHACRDFWHRAVSESERYEATNVVMEDHAGFFGICIPSFFKSYVLTIMALHETRDDSITLPGLLRRVRESPRTNGTPVAEIESLLAQTESVTSRLRQIRHKHIAHISIETLERDFFKEAALTYNDVINLWDQSWDIFSSLSFHIDRSRESTLQDNTYQFDRIINSLSLNHEHHP